MTSSATLGATVASVLLVGCACATGASSASSFLHGAQAQAAATPARASAGNAARAPAGREVVVRRDLVYGRVAGERLLLDAYLPTDGGLHPAVVFVHGGGFRAGDKAFLAPVEQPFAPLGSALARRGFVAFSIDYRLAPRFRFPAAERDVLAAVRWIREHSRGLGVDPAWLALFGASAGGNLAALAATAGRGPLDAGTRVRAAVSWSGPMDLLSFYAGHRFVGDYLGCAPSDCPGRYRAASPVSQVDPSDPPLLLANGSAEIVPLAQAQAMAARLQAAHIPHGLVVVPGNRHAGQYAGRVWRATLRFLTRHLRPR